jgi:hypothetical protein
MFAGLHHVGTADRPGRNRTGDLWIQRPASLAIGDPGAVRRYASLGGKSSWRPGACSAHTQPHTFVSLAESNAKSERREQHPQAWRHGIG